MRCVFLSRVCEDDGSFGTYRPVAIPTKAQIVVEDVPKDCADWQVAVLANGTQFEGRLQKTMKVSFSDLGWSRPCQ